MRNKLLVISLILIWFLILSVIGLKILIDTPRQIKKDTDFINTRLKPSIDYVMNYQRTNNKLPEYRDFYNWEKKYYNDYTINLNEKNDSLLVGVIEYIKSCSGLPSDCKERCNEFDWNKDFLILSSRGGWDEYYISRTKEFVTNNYKWIDGIEGCLICMLIGVLPFLFFLVKNKKNR